MCHKLGRHLHVVFDHTPWVPGSKCIVVHLIQRVSARKDDAKDENAKVWFS